MSHFILKCECGAIIAQCRCIGDKQVRVSAAPCDACLVKTHALTMETYEAWKGND
jgi:hypothetical protein